MVVKDSNTQAIIDAIANLVRETQQSNTLKRFSNLFQKNSLQTYPNQLMNLLKMQMRKPLSS